MLAGFVFAMVCLPGCLTNLLHHTLSSPASKAPVGPVHQVQTMWENHVVVTQDVVNNGKPLVGLAGQVYFFGEEIGYPVAGKGTLTVDCREILPDGNVKMLERWEIDPVTLQKLCRKERMGWGYTIFLPWQTYRPDLTRVQLQVKFVGESGIPLFSPPTAVSLSTEGPPVITSNVVPAAGTKTKN